MNQIIYIGLIEGVECHVPVNAIKKQRGIYQITNNEDFDPTDFTSLWEFSVGDVVRCEKKGEDLYAVELIESKNTENIQHHLMYELIKGIKVNGKKWQKELNSLRSFLQKIPQRKHPAVQKLIELIP